MNTLSRPSVRKLRTLCPNQSDKLFLQEEEREAEEESVATGRPVPPPQLPALMLAYRARTPEEYVAKIIESIKSSEVEQTLLVLPFDYTMRLLRVMERLLEARKSVEVIMNK